MEDGTLQTKLKGSVFKMEINKATRATLIQSAVSTLDTCEQLRKSELASGTSYFLGKDRIIKIVNTGRAEINVKLPEEAELQLTNMDYQNWSDKPRSGVRYYGVAHADIINLVLNNLPKPTTTETEENKPEEVKKEVKKSTSKNKKK